LANLQNHPKALQDRVQKKLFEKVEIAKFTPKECQTHKSNFKYYLNIGNVLDTAKEEGVKKRKLEVTKQMQSEGMNWEIITRITGISQEEIQNL